MLRFCVKKKSQSQPSTITTLFIQHSRTELIRIKFRYKSDHKTKLFHSSFASQTTEFRAAIEMEIIFAIVVLCFISIASSAKVEWPSDGAIRRNHEFFSDNSTVVTPTSQVPPTTSEVPPTTRNPNVRDFKDLAFAFLVR